MAFMSLQSTVCVNLDGDALLMGRYNALCTAPGVYSQAWPLGDTGFYGLREKDGGRCIITDCMGNPLSEPIYEDVTMCGKAIAIRLNGFWALSDRALNLLTDWRYTAIFPAEEQFFAFCTNLWDDRADELYILDPLGRERATGTYLLYTDLIFSDGLCACVSAETGCYGYIDGEGKWVREPSCLWTGAYTNGLAAVSTSEGNGVIDSGGDWILSPVHSSLSLSSKFIICRESVSNELIIYRRTSEGLIRLDSIPEGYAAQVGQDLCVYADQYVYLLSEEGDIRGIFSGDTLLYEGFGTQVIARDRNGMYVYDAESARMSTFFDSLQRLKNVEFYLYSEADENESLHFGVLTKDFQALLNAEIGRAHV